MTLSLKHGNALEICFGEFHFFRFEKCDELRFTIQSKLKTNETGVASLACEIIPFFLYFIEIWRRWKYGVFFFF